MRGASAKQLFNDRLNYFYKLCNPNLVFNNSLVTVTYAIFRNEPIRKWRWPSFWGRSKAIRNSRCQLYSLNLWKTVRSVWCSSRSTYSIKPLVLNDESIAKIDVSSLTRSRSFSKMISTPALQLQLLFHQNLKIVSLESDHFLIYHLWVQSYKTIWFHQHTMGAYQFY